MKKEISLAQYRCMDLTVLAIVLVVTQALTVKAATAWFPDQLYIVSPTAAVVTLVLMRWGGWAGIHAVLGALALTLASGGTAQHALIYSVGNLVSLLALPLLLALGKERVRQSAFLSELLAATVQLTMLAGRAAVAALLGAGPEQCLGFITTDLLSVLFTLVVIGVVRKADGLFEDQKHYLLRVARERENERRDQP